MKNKYCAFAIPDPLIIVDRFSAAVDHKIINSVVSSQIIQIVITPY